MSHFLESLEEETTQNIQNFEGHIVKRIVSAKKKPNHFYYLVNFEDMEGIFWFNSEEADYIIPIKMIEEFKETHPKIFNKKHKINNINIVNNNNNNNNNNNDNSNNNNNNKEESTQIEEMIFQKDLSNWKNTLQHSKRKASKCNPQILLKTNPQFEKDILDIFKIEDISNVDIQVMVGGYTCHSFSLAYKEKLAFLKIQNNDSGYAMLDREFKGLEFFKKILKFLNYKKIKMPKIYSCQKLKNKGAYLLMEFIERDPILNPDTSDGWILMGEILAEFHQICIEKNVSDKFGGEIDGFLSILPMPNNFKNNWIEFFIENRFKFELDIFKEISTKNNEIVYYGESLLKKIPGFFKNLTIKPVLCHGDLNNNWFFSKKNKKLIFFDVCPFFGHNEFDFTQLPLVDRVKDGISSYFRNFRKDEGYEKRHTLYQIFRCLHDMNTFGYLQHKKHILKYFDSLGFLREEFEEEKMKRVKQVQKKQTQKKKNPKDANLILSDSRLFQIVPKNLELLQKRIKNFENIKLGVLFASGSYCPPHFNHITVIKSTLEFLEKEKNFFFLNCFISPLNDHYIKSKLNGFCINVQDRCQLLENFLKDYNRITVNKTQKIGQIFPEITIEHIKTLLPKDLISKKKIYRVELCGADSVEKAVGWLGKFIERGDVELAVVRRNGYDKTLDKFLKQSPLSDKIHVNRNWEGPDLSSTEIRKLFKEKNFSKLEEMMPKENIEFLKNIFK